MLSLTPVSSPEPLPGTVYKITDFTNVTVNRPGNNDYQGVKGESGLRGSLHKHCPD